MARLSMGDGRPRSVRSSRAPVRLRRAGLPLANTSQGATVPIVNRARVGRASQRKEDQNDSREREARAIVRPRPRDRLPGSRFHGRGARLRHRASDERPHRARSCPPSLRVAHDLGRSLAPVGAGIRFHRAGASARLCARPPDFLPSELANRSRSGTLTVVNRIRGRPG